MADLGAIYTDKEIENLNHRLHGIYKEAEKDINRKMRDFNERYKVKEAKYAKQVEEGKITQEQFDNWKKGQVFQGKQWQAKKASIEQTLHNSNVIASKIVNKQAIDVLQMNLNYSSYAMEKGMGVNFGFNVYDKTTVINLIRNEPNLLPVYKPKAGLDNAWNSKKITRQITLGIIEGESLDDIANRLAKATSSQNMNSMMTHARTLMTSAQNSGRLISYKNAEKLGIDIEKEWMATLDSHTRDSHADVDGERQPLDKKFSNGLMYPAEVGGAPAEVYNCRCTMVSNIKKYPSVYQRRDNIAGKPIDNMTYRQWEKAKKIAEDMVKKAKSATVDYEKYGGKEIFDILKKYGDYDTFIDKSTTKEFDLAWDKLGSVSNIEKAYAGIDKDIELAKASMGIDYSKYGGKEVYDLISKYPSFTRAASEMTSSEFEKMVVAFGKKDVSEIDKIIREAHAVRLEQPVPKVEKVASPVKVEKSPKLPKVEYVVRDRDYINNVTELGLTNYPDVKNNIDKDLQNIAQQFNVTKSEAKEAIEKGLAKMVDASDFTMRIRSDDLVKVLNDGYFKNQFETGTSGGALSPHHRKRLENEMFGVPMSNGKNMTDADRPVYGMFCPKYEDNVTPIQDYYTHGPGSWYGDGVTVILKKESVLRNATMTLGDSLDYEDGLVGMDPTKIVYGGFYKSGRSAGSNLDIVYKLGAKSDSTEQDAKNAVIRFANRSDHYMEYQLHGQQSHSADNIERVILSGSPYNSGKFDNLVKELDSRGIPYTVNNS